MIPLKLMAPILTLTMGLIPLAFQEEWHGWHERKTSKHQWVLRILIALMVIGSLVTCWIVWKDSSQSSMLQAQVGEILKGNADLLLVLPVLFIMNVWVVPREERHLEARFAESSLRYTSQVGRWL